MPIDVNLEHSTCELKPERIKPFLDKITQKDVPDFVLYKPDFKKIDELKKKYSKYKNIIVIGNGGSVSSLRAICNSRFQIPACRQASPDSRFLILDTIDPDYIAYLEKTCPRNETLVIPSSHSGSNVLVTEATLQFIGYPMLVITSDNNEALVQIVKKRNLDWLEHPGICGRFTGLTEVSLLPAALTGIDIQKIWRGGQQGYKQFTKSEATNLALLTAISLLILEQKGYTEIYMPIYSKQLEGFSELITQLFHETFGKKGRGLTVLALPAPECQHHTSQRFFDGRKNMVLAEVKCQMSNVKCQTNTPDDLKDIKLRDGRLALLNNLSLNQALRCEAEGTLQNAVNKNIPAISIKLERVDEENIGEFLAFWQMLSIYSAHLRNVDPFGQRGVEESKRTSWEMRKKR